MGRADPHSYSDIEQGNVTALELQLEVDFSARRLRGTATLHFAESGCGPLDLDTRALTITSVESASTDDGSTAPLAWKLHDPEGFLGARLEIQRPAGTRAITVQYTTAPEASGLQWLEPAHTSGGKHPYLFSQCQPHHARSMVPIQDTPRARFRYQASVTVPKPLSVVMSAAPGARVEGAEAGTSTFTFEMPQPIPAYLLALAVGEIASREVGPRSTVYAEPADLDAAAYEFGTVDEMLTAAETLFGPYLWQRFDFLVMPPAFPYGGMENPRLTFLTPTLIAGDRSLVNVLAHELAHSWTGNLVTNATMNDFWLNEGFTVWAERRILETQEGLAAVALAAAVGRHALELDIKAFGPGSPLTRLENDLAGTDPDEIYSSVPYEKGFLFVVLLERTVGRDRFDRFLRGYIERFKFTSITTAEFVAHVEAELPGLLDKVGAERWLHGSGIPDNCPTFDSGELKSLQALAAGWSKGARPDAESSRKWSVEAWQIYLHGLPQVLSEADCRWLDERFSLTQSGNCEILCNWLTIAAGSSYAPAFDRLRSFLGSVGRMKYLKPLYATLHRNEETRAMAREIFDGAAERYHPIARAALEGLLRKKMA